MPNRLLDGKGVFFCDGWPPFRLVVLYRLAIIVDPPSVQQRAKEIALSFLKHEMIIAAETLADVWDIIGVHALGASSAAGMVLFVGRLFVCLVGLLRRMEIMRSYHRSCGSFGATAPHVLRPLAMHSRGLVCFGLFVVFCGRRHPVLHDSSERAVQAVG